VTIYSEAEMPIIYARENIASFFSGYGYVMKYSLCDERNLIWKSREESRETLRESTEKRRLQLNRSSISRETHMSGL